MTDNNFMALGVSSQFAPALENAKFVTPTEIQVQSIPVLLTGQDVLGVAQTGTGKTAAFGLPMLQQLLADDQPAKAKRPRALVIAPTRELASQILQELKTFSVGMPLKLACIFGGVGQSPQVKALQRGVDLLVATPGRLLDLRNQGFLALDQVRYLALDEADRLLDLGFSKDIQKIVAQLPKQRQTLLFSATMPQDVVKLAHSILHNPHRIDVLPKQVTVEKITQQIAFVGSKQKQFALTHLLFRKEVKKAIVFTRTKYGADRVTRKLNQAGVLAEAIHGNKSQNARTRALDNFKGGKIWVLVATDIAARGIDVDGVTHVINFELPQDPESYVHRIGRTGRAGADGAAWSLVDTAEKKNLKVIERLIRFSLEVIDIDFSNEEAADKERVASAQQNQSGRAINDNARAQQSKGNRSGGSSDNSSGAKKRRPRRRKVRGQSAQSTNNAA